MFGQAVQILRAFPVTRAPQLKLEADANDNPGMRVVVVDGHPATRRVLLWGRLIYGWRSRKESIWVTTGMTRKGGEESKGSEPSVLLLTDERRLIG